MKIPRDDEDFNSGMFARFFTAAGFFVKFGFIKTLPFEDKPFYFEPEMEEIELWEKHFPPGQLSYFKKNRKKVFTYIV